MIWREIPLLRVFVFFAAGIILTVNTHFYWKWSVAIALLLATLVLVQRSQRKLRANRKFNRLAGLCLLLMFFFLGMWNTELHTEILKDNHFGHSLDSPSHAIVRITKQPVEKARSFKVEAVVEQLVRQGTVREVRGRALMYLPKGKETSDLRYGDVLLVSNRFREIDPPMNPGQFNYKRYLSFHNIYHQAYIPEEQWHLIDRNRGSWLWHRITTLRSHLLGFLDREFSSERERAVASALLLGYTDLLDDETIKQYSSSGAMHVLAVSGLHVVIIFYVLNVMLSFMNKKRNLRLFVKLPLLVAGVWFYALLTGMSPSVQRAAVMLTFIVFGESTQRRNHIYSSLIGSAALLLALDPFIITEIGFILSYLAVLGIVVMQRGLYRRLYFKNRIADWAWQITCVSIAAQVATFPIALVYFHQFPTYFLVSNLFVIPVSCIVLYAGLLLFVFSPLSWLSTYMADALEWGLWFMNEGIALVDRLPASLISGLFISKLEAVLLYAVLACTIIYLKLKRPRALQAAFAFGILTVISIGVRKVNFASANSFIVYHAQGLSALATISGTKAVIQADSALLNDPDKMLFSVDHHLWALGIRDQERLANTQHDNSLIMFSGRSFYTLDRSMPRQAPPSPIEVDYLIVKGAPYLRMEDISKYFRFGTIVFDTSNPRWLTEKWTAECKTSGLTSHDVNREGAFVLNL